MKDFIAITTIQGEQIVINLRHVVVIAGFGQGLAFKMPDGTFINSAPMQPGEAEKIIERITNA